MAECYVGSQLATISFFVYLESQPSTPRMRSKNEGTNQTPCFKNEEVSGLYQSSKPNIWISFKLQCRQRLFRLSCLDSKFWF